MIKIDWLSFVYIPDDEEKATYKNVFSAFLARFPKVENILDETVVCSSGKGYYTSGVLWNDGIMICWDDQPKNENFFLFNGRELDPWGHGVYVSIPAHGLANLIKILDLPENTSFDDDFRDIIPVFEILKANNCRLSRLDIAFDDETKTFYPRDFFRYWDNNQVQSPCHSYTFCGSKGSTFYVGSRSNKILRIYDKEVQSQGENKSIRYEIETHHRYANDLMEMILSGSFDFFEVLQKWFIRLKEKSSCDSLDTKARLSQLSDLPEWVDFIKNSSTSSFANKCEFPVHSRDVSMENKRYWLRRQVAKSLVELEHIDGPEALYNLLDSVVLSPKDYKIVSDSLRIAQISEQMYQQQRSKSHIMRMVCDEINKAFPVC